MTITGVSPATASSGMADLVRVGALIRKGKLRYTHCELAIYRRTIKALAINAYGNFD